MNTFKFALVVISTQIMIGSEQSKLDLQSASASESSSLQKPMIETQKKPEVQEDVPLIVSPEEKSIGGVAWIIDKEQFQQDTQGVTKELKNGKKRKK